MKNAKIGSITEVEIIGFESGSNGQLWATVSFRDTDRSQGINNGYGNVMVPVNPRPLQRSVRGNILVDQSVKQESTPVENNS